MCIISKIADSLDTKDLNSHIVSGVILVKQALILTLSVDAVDLALVKSLTQVVYYVLNHHDLQLDLLTNQLNYVTEGTLALLKYT